MFPVVPPSQIRQMYASGTSMALDASNEVEDVRMHRTAIGFAIGLFRVPFLVLCGIQAVLWLSNGEPSQIVWFLIVVATWLAFAVQQLGACVQQGIDDGLRQRDVHPRTRRGES
jgi:hypothetical protein